MPQRLPFALLLAHLALAGCAASRPQASHPAERPVRVMSLNQCTDQLVLALLPPERIASVTWLSRDPRFSAEVAAARRVAVNHGGVEEVVRARPDLIVADTFSNPAGRAMLHRLGYPMIEVADASSAADIRRNVRQVADALGEGPRGEALIARMNAQLADPPVTARPIRVAAWDRDGMGSGAMLGIALRAAGAVDVGGKNGGDVETLLAASPDLLLDREEAAHDASLGDNRARNAIVRARWPASRRLHIPRATLFCATPAIGRAALALREQLAQYRAAS